MPVRPLPTSPPLARALLGLHVLVVGAGLAWLIWTAGRESTPLSFDLLITRNRPLPPMPLWAVLLWACGYLLMLAAPRWPALGLAIYSLLAVVVARYEPGIEISQNFDVLLWLCGMMLTAVAVWCVRTGARPRLPSARSWLTWTLLALATWIAITCLAAWLRDGRWNPSPEHHPRQFIQAAIVFLLASQFLGDRRASLAVALAIIAGLALRGRVLSPFGVWKQEDIASLLVIALPLALVALSAVTSWTQRLLLALLLVPLVANNLLLLWATQNRTALAALGVVVLAMALASRRPWVAIVGIVPAGVALAFWLPGSEVWTRFTDIWTGGREAGSFHERVELWRAAWRMGVAHPWMGVGSGNFSRFALDYAPALRRDLPAHSNYLAMFAETGVPGLLLYLACFAGAILVLIQTIRLAGRDWPAPAARALIPALLGYLAIGLALTRHDQVLAYLLAGWAAGLYNQLAGPDLLREPEPLPASPPPPPPLPAAAPPPSSP